MMVENCLAVLERKRKGILIRRNFIPILNSFGCMLFYFNECPQLFPRGCYIDKIGNIQKSFLKPPDHDKPNLTQRFWGKFDLNVLSDRSRQFPREKGQIMVSL